MNQLTNILDLRTVMLVSVVIYAIGALQVYGLWRQNRNRFPGLGFLASNYGLQTAALLALVARGLIPEAISIYLSNSLIMAGILTGYYGLTVFCGKPQRMGLWFVLFIAYLAGIHYWYDVSPSLMWRVINNSAVLTLSGLLTAYFLFFMSAEPIRGFVRPLAWVHVLYSMFFAARIMISISEHREHRGYFEDKTMEAVLGILYPALFVMLTQTISLMINRRLNWETEQAQAQVKVLSGLLPICAHCKNVRDDRGYWNQIESYISHHSEADFSHGICPECEKRHYPEFLHPRS